MEEKVKSEVRCEGPKVRGSQAGGWMGWDGRMDHPDSSSKGDWTWLEWAKGLSLLTGQGSRSPYSGWQRVRYTRLVVDMMGWGLAGEDNPLDLAGTRQGTLWYHQDETSNTVPGRTGKGYLRGT